MSFYQKDQIPPHLIDFFEPIEIGLEPTPEAFVEQLVNVFREVRRVLRDDGTLWLNLGDSYAAARAGHTHEPHTFLPSRGNEAFGDFRKAKGGGARDALSIGLKHKDLVGIPWRVAFALQADGWYLRSDIIWCLSGGAWVYARTQKGDMPVMVKDLVRLNPSTVKLWNGTKWTQVLGWNLSLDTTEKLELVLRSGERIGCTGGHKWPTQRGNIAARDIRVGDLIATCQIPEPDGAQSPGYMTLDSAWLVGLYLAEGSRSNNMAQLALHADEVKWLARIESVAHHFGGAMTYVVMGNKLSVCLSGRMLMAHFESYVGGHTAHDKHLTNACWRLPNEYLKEIAQGYFDGDGHSDTQNSRVRLGFTRNYSLERDLRTLAARLGATISLRPVVATCQTGKFPAFRGEWRWSRSGHWNERAMGEVVEIRVSRARKFWDIGVEDEPHLFALASGVLTHNSKGNVMPESVTDRPTKSHEYIFLLTKNERYFYDAEAIREPAVTSHMPGSKVTETFHYGVGNGGNSGLTDLLAKYKEEGLPTTRNKRSVWHINPKPYKGAHFACVDEGTECLTIDGWKKYNELSVGTLAAQFDVESGTLSWAPISNIAVYHVQNEPMVSATCRDMAMLLTPNHRTVISRRHPKTRNWKSWQVVRADQLLPSHAVPVSGVWDDKEGDCPISPDWAELLGWYIAEGCASTQSWAVEIYQSVAANPDKVDRIRSLLEATGAIYDVAESERVWYGRDAKMAAFQVRGFGATLLRQHAPGEAKRLPPSVLRWHPELLRRLLNGLVDGDGHRRPEDDRFSFIQKSKETADMVQAIGVRLGYATVCRPHGNTWVVYFTTKDRISFRGTAGKGSAPEIVRYTGAVWCPKLPKGTWVARKNGRAFITGNTFPETLPEVCIRAGTSEKGACSKCGSPWERVVERVGDVPMTGRRQKISQTAANGAHLTRRGGTQRSTLGAGAGGDVPSRQSRFIEWQSSCECGASITPCIVLDPFTGSGTTLAVAKYLRRDYLGCELNPEYHKLIEERLRPAEELEAERQGFDEMLQLGDDT